MFVKYKLRVDQIASSGSTINIPLDMKFITIDQAEVVEKDFVDIEVEKAINPIIDYEKTRFVLTNTNNVILDNISYELNFINNGNLLSQTNYSDIGFNYDDIKYRKNGFVKSFLRLNFYDNDIPTNQRLISFLTIFSKITNKDIIPIGSPNAGLPIGVNLLPVRFILSNPIKDPNGFAEGFYLYHYKDEVLETLPKELFMRAEFNNAKTGKRTTFTTVNSPQTVDNVINKLHTKYILKRDVTGYYYEIDNNYSTNIIYTSDVDGDGNGIGGTIDGGLKVKLYEIQVI